MAPEKIQELEEIEARLNAGSGITAIKTLISFLKKGEIQEACRYVLWDGDKMRRDEEAWNWINENLCDYMGTPVNEIT